MRRRGIEWLRDRVTDRIEQRVVAMAPRVVKYVHAVAPEEATGLVASVYDEVATDFQITPPIILHSPAPRLLAGVWCVVRETLIAGRVPRSHPSFDRVLSSFMFHHLQPGQREKTLREVRRVLKPGGFLHLLDFGGPGAPPHGFLAHLLHVSHRLSDNFEGRILTLMRQAGLLDPGEVGHRAILVGQVAHYRASAP
ncbi:MAG: class I SAM-dependent methyltransferase [Candidatus Rokuibacteriota bacterium]